MWFYRHVAVFSAVFFLITYVCQAEQCSSTDEESLLKPGLKYTYHFKSEAFGEAVGTTDDRSKISLNCDVQISHSGECLYSFQFQNCLLTAAGGPPGSESAWIDKQVLEDLSRYPVTFLLINGEITDVYSHPDDPIQFVNVKRGALSAFVFKLSFTMSSKTEVSHTDIHGTCPLTITLNDDIKENVKTSKDMLHCHYPSRTDWQFSPWSMFWNMSFIQYVINSTTDCDYKLDSGAQRIDNVFCKERHAIMLESSQRTAVAVQTNIYYTMTFKGAIPHVSTNAYPELTRKTGIIFEYEKTPDPDSNPENFLATAEKMISDLVHDSADEIRLHTIPQFTSFVAWIRTASDLIPFVDSVKSCSFSSGRMCSDHIKELSLSYLSDALVQCNTPACFDALVYLAQQGDLSSSYLNFVFYSWSNTHISKPAVLKSVMELCKNTDSNLCWISLATMLKRTLKQHHDIEDQKQMQEIAFYLRDIIEELCSSNTENYEKLLRYLKAVGNMGKHYLSLINDGEELLLGCASKSDIPHYVRAASLEALKNLEPCKERESCPQTYEKAMNILTKTTESTLVRTSAFNLLMEMEGDMKFEKEIVALLEKENDMELQSYIAQGLKNMINDPEANVHRRRFVRALENMLNVKDLSLETYIHNPNTKSFISTKHLFGELSFLPEEMKKFGFKDMFAKVYQLYDVFPRHYHKESWWKLFNTYFPAFQTGAYSEGLEQIAIIIQQAIKEVNFEDSTVVNNVMKVLPEVIKGFSESTEILQNFNFNDDVIANIKKLEELFKNYRPESKPFFAAYFDLFGSTLTYLASGDLIAFGSKLSQLNKLMEDLNHGMTYNATRVIRVIEAYHQVPTMMGLPLNWTTNATLAVSLRSGLKLHLEKESMDVRSKAFIQPSMALTFLNRMVLDFPSITQIGVQANSSGYTSTQWKINLEYSKEKKILRIEKPSQSQKLLELFRSNQLIKHNDYIDIVDWDIERTHSSLCSDEETNQVFGVGLCVEKSYPMVTNRLKPWALMSGWCKWQLLLQPTDENVKSYDIEILKLPTDKFNGIALRLKVFGSKDKNELIFNTHTDDTTGEARAEVTIPALPEFHISLSKMRNVEGGSYKSLSTLKFKEDYQYQLIYNEEDKYEEQEDTLGDINRSSKGKKTIVYKKERLCSLSTPFNYYRIHREDSKRGENVNTEIHASYENFNKGRKWVKQIFPPAVWENDSKAWLQVHVHWKAPSENDDSVLRQTSCFVKVPTSIIELSARSLKMTGRERLNVNVTKVETATRKLLGFVNFTHDYWMSQRSWSDMKDINVWNLTIPRKSWSVSTQNLRENSKWQMELSLKRAVMTPNNPKKNDYVGWWSDDVSEDYSLKEHELKTILDIDDIEISTEDLVKKYPSMTAKEMDGMKHKLVKADLTINYPFFTGPESLRFDGFLLFSKDHNLGIFRFQNDFDMESSYNNIRLTSLSVYRTENELSFMDHKSYITHLPTDTKAFHIIKYRRWQTDIKCDEGIWEHDVLSHIFDWKSRVTVKCRPGTHLRTLNLRFTTQSSMWDMLNNELDQRVEQINPDYTYETMNMSYPLAYINVTAEWIGQKTDHFKRATHTCLMKECQDIEFVLKSYHNGKLSMDLNLLGETNRNTSYKRVLSQHNKKLQMWLGYADNQNKDLEPIEFSGEIIRKDLHIWKAKINSETYSKLKETSRSVQESILRNVLRMSKDPQHPVNIIVSPALKMTLYDYWQSLQEQTASMKSGFWSSVKDTLKTFSVFYEIPVELISNAFTTSVGYAIQTYNDLKEKSVTIWAINYFHLPYYIQQGVQNWNKGIELAFNSIHPEDNNTRYEFTTGRVLKLYSFKSWPDLNFDIFKYLYPEDIETTVKQFTATPNTKFAMIFGPLHVYTFDGHLFDSVEYSSDCLFLLAHDLRKSMFSVLTSEKSLHVLFPEMTVSINNENEVFINESTTPSKLPIQSENGKVVVRRGSVIEVWSPTLRVACRSEDFLCIIELDTWHSGGTFGLLGNADGSPQNDLMMPNGDVTTNTLEFIRSYEISGKSECKNLQLSSKPKSEQNNNACFHQFMGLCEQTEDVRKAFLQACEIDIRDGHSPCYAATGYVAVGHHKNLPCTTACNAKKKDNKNIGKRLEVVLIVQKHNSLILQEKKKSVYKGMERLLSAIDEKFKSSGYSSIQHSLVGFGGKGVHKRPTVHTTERRVWLPLRNLASDVLQTLEFSGEESADNLEALKYALENLGHDTFDSKVFIQITEGDKQTKNKKLTESLRQQLENNGITLYTISHYPSIEKGKKVFGVRADGLIFPSPKKDGTAFMDFPKGDLAKLTAATKGSLFLSKFLVANTPASYFGEIAEEVWAKVNKESNLCRECKTVRSGWWFAVNQCNIVTC